jgi:SNF2 family DNA or RNA helicase
MIIKVAAERILLIPVGKENLKHMFPSLVCVYGNAWRYSDGAWGFPLTAARALWNVMPDYHHIFPTSLVLALDEKARAEGIEWLKSLPLPSTSTLKTDLAPHQEEDIKVMTGFKRFGLFDDMGTGKTLTILAAFAHKAGAEKLIIVCPKTIKRVNWEQQVKDHTTFSVEVVSDKTLNTRADIFIVHYENVGKYTPLLERICENFDTVLVADEATEIKNHKAMRTKIFFKLAKKAHTVWLASGTPAANKPESIYTLLKFLDPTLFEDYETFISTYANRDVFGSVISYKNLSVLADKMKLVSIRHQLGEVATIPEVHVTTLVCKFTQPQKELYQGYKEDILKSVKNTDSMPCVLAQMTALRQLSSDYTMITERMNMGIPPKYALLDKIINLLRRDERLIIATCFNHVHDVILNRYANLKPVSIRGKVSDAKRTLAVNSYNSGESRILVIHPRSGGLGLNLQAGSKIVFFDRDFHFVQNVQTEHRIQRIGQKHNCQIVNLVCEGTLDDYILDVLNEKSQLSAKILKDYLEKGGL